MYFMDEMLVFPSRDARKGPGVGHSDTAKNTDLYA
jgi:hypothetical protein